MAPEISCPLPQTYLTPSNLSKFSGAFDFQAATPEGQYARFGVREVVRFYYDCFKYSPAYLRWRAAWRARGCSRPRGKPSSSQTACLCSRCC